MIALIACIDKEFNIGKNNELLFNFKQDKEIFKRLTTDNVVVMGRKTFESLPGKKPLKDRTNIILTRDLNYHVSYANDVIVVNDYDTALDIIKEFEEFGKEIYIIGGGEIYNLFKTVCDTIILTEVDTVVKDADTKFPSDIMDQFNKTTISDGQFNSINFHINLYSRIKNHD